ncbi:interactor of HORMAD1 protein 1 isoform X2 [Tamandua tetradactyla]|uniref:interactor of HORMAD1 protein 1 isoform X2 n=1 Tax=Tamandua tetradactyla TaxID=48850 RepID=UPI0040545EFE
MFRISGVLAGSPGRWLLRFSLALKFLIAFSMWEFWLRSSFDLCAHFGRAIFIIGVARGYGLSPISCTAWEAELDYFYKEELSHVYVLVYSEIQFVLERTTRSSNWNNNQTDYSSLSDSQFLFGSQFCPENSETLSAPLDFGTHLRHPKQTQQNSLNSEPSIFTKYQAKPQLFGGDSKNGGLFPLPLSAGKSKDLLEQFEEKKKRTKDICASETLYNCISHIRESINRLQTSVEKSEEHLSSRSQSILDSLENVAKTLQETARAQSDLVFEAVQDKGSMEQAILEMQKTFEVRQAEFVEMKSNLKHLEVLVAQQSKDLEQLCEHLGQMNVPTVLAGLKRLTSEPQIPRHVKDSTSQTSPALTQGLNFTRQEKSALVEPVMWQAQALPDAWNPSTGFLEPREFGIWSEEAKGNAVQEDATLPAAGSCKGNGHAKDEEVQADCKHWHLTKTGPENHGSIPGHQVPGDRDLVSQGTSKLLSLELNNFATSIKNPGQEYQAKDVLSCDSCEQRLVAELKGRTVERGKKGKRQQPRKGRRGRLLVRKQQQTLSKACTFNSKNQSPPPPVSGPQRLLSGQQEPLAYPLHLQGPSSSRNLAKPSCPTLGGAITSSKTARTVQRSLLQVDEHSSQDNNLLSSSSRGDHQMSWFSDLNLLSSESPLYKEPGKNLLYDLAFDSSDDDF